MLGKLMKYEWKAGWKLFIPANVAIVCLAVMTGGANYLSEHLGFAEEKVMDELFVSLLILSYMLSVITVFAGGLIWLLWRFYTSTYGDQGYLLHTLPVDKHHIIVAKALVSAFWILLTTAVARLSFWLLGGADLAGLVGSLFAGRSGFWYLSVYVSAEELNVFTTVMAIVAAVAGVFAKIMQVAASASLGQISANHKVMASLGFYVAFNVLQSMLKGVISVLIIMFADGAEGVLNGFMWHYSWEPALILGLLYSAGFYLLTWYVMEHRLNLE